MKKILCLLLIFIFTFPLVGCAKSKAYINGISIDEYDIVYSDEDTDYSKRAARYIRDQIMNRTGHWLRIKEDDTPRFGNEIVVGNTNRDISKELDADTEGLEFAILADAGSIALEGDYFIIAAAAYFFIDCFVPGGDYEAVVPQETMIHKPIVKKAENFILLIGDGMGYYQTKLFEQMENNIEYSDGEDLFYGYLLPYHGFSRTDSLSGTTDSAAGGTALACGYKTNNKYVGKDKNGNDLKNLTELAFELGKNTAVLSTDKKTGATPSTFSAHASDRNNSKEILLDQVETYLKYGTIIECGFDYYKHKDIKEIVEGYIEDTLDEFKEDNSGFFIMYEEAHIDKHSHNNKISKTFEALVRFNQAIGRFMEFAFYNPNTFVLITADHETGGLTPDENGVLEYTTGDHTSANVPIFAYGMGAELFDGVEIENIQIAQTIAALMGRKNFGDQSVYKPLTK